VPDEQCASEMDTLKLPATQLPPTALQISDRCHIYARCCQRIAVNPIWSHL